MTEPDFLVAAMRMIELLYDSEAKAREDYLNGRCSLAELERRLDALFGIQT